VHGRGWVVRGRKIEKVCLIHVRCLQRCWRSMSQEKHQFSSGKGYVLPTYSIARELIDRAIMSNLSSTMDHDKLVDLWHPKTRKRFFCWRNLERSINAAVPGHTTIKAELAHLWNSSQTSLLVKCNVNSPNRFHHASHALIHGTHVAYSQIV
jgi:hypothetical protein